MCQLANPGWQHLIAHLAGVMITAEANRLNTTEESVRSSGRIRMPDLVRWLSKSSAICAHFRRLADISISPRLSSLVLTRRLDVKCISKSPLESHQVVVSNSNLTRFINDGLPENKDPEPSTVNTMLQSLSKGLKNAELPLSNQIGTVI